MSIHYYNSMCIYVVQYVVYVQKHSNKQNRFLVF